MITIVTINRNHASGLLATIASLQAQVVQDFQWILIDGNSSDDSLKIAQNYARPLDVLISEKDLGIYNAMNKGTIQAQGEQILFLNAGDVFVSPLAIKTIYAEWRSNLDLMLFGFEVRGIIRKAKPRWWRYWSMPTSHQAIVYAASLMQNNLFDERYRYAADFEHYLRINRKLLAIKCIPVLLIRNEPYGSDQHLSIVLHEYRQALLVNGAPFWWAHLVFLAKHIYLGRVLK